MGGGMKLAVTEDAVGLYDVLVVAAAFGRGHLQASAAVDEALAGEWPGCRTAVVDFTSVAAPHVMRAARWAYSFSLRRLPVAWRCVYRGTAHVPPDSAWRLGLGSLGRRQLLDLVHRLRPSVVVATYPAAADSLAQLRRGGWLQAPVVTVMTDYAVHGQWLHPWVDHTCVASDEAAAAALALGIPASRVEVTGIPVRHGFARPPRRDQARAALGLEPDRPVVVVMGPAGTKVAPGADGASMAVRALKVLSPEVRILAGPREEDVPLAMAAADLVISKAGGLTTAEAMAVGVPLVLFRWLPGQEEENVAYLCRHGVAVKVRTRAELVRRVAALLGDRERLGAMRRAAVRLGRRDAAPVIARRVRELASQGQGRAQPIWGAGGWRS
jgi:processive 1,2-diacylglycerol beta-glucosyltransferase